MAAEKQLAVFDTRLTADSVEWCPTPGSEEILACGTYQLNQQETVRLGSLTLFHWDGNKWARQKERERGMHCYVCCPQVNQDSREGD